MTTEERAYISEAALHTARTIGILNDFVIDLAEQEKEKEKAEPDLGFVQECMRLLHYGAVTMQKVCRPLMEEGDGAITQILTSSHSDRSDGGSTIPSRSSQSEQPVT